MNRPKMPEDWAYITCAVLLAAVFLVGALLTWRLLSALAVAGPLDTTPNPTPGAVPVAAGRTWALQ